MTDIRGSLGFHQRQRAFIAPYGSRYMVISLKAIDMRPMLEGDDDLAARFLMPRSYSIDYAPRDALIISPDKPAVLRHYDDGSQAMLMQVSDYVALMRAQGYAISEF